MHIAVFALPTVALIAAGAPRGWVIGLMAVHAPLGGSRAPCSRIVPPRGRMCCAGVALGALVARKWHEPEEVVVDSVG